MPSILQVRMATVFVVLFSAATLLAAGEKLNTSYISTSPGSSTVIQVAKEVGFFDKNGFDATVIFISGSVRGIQAILAGEIPIGEGGGPGLASARLAGGDVVAIAGNVNVLPYYLVAQPSIKRPEDLKGKIGGTHIAGTTAEFALKVGLKKIGLERGPGQAGTERRDVAHAGGEDLAVAAEGVGHGRHADLAEGDV